jgi:hypothetical protein
MSELVKQIKESDDSTLVSKQFSDQMQDAFRSHSSLYKQFNMLASSDMDFLPTTRRATLLKSIERSTEQLGNVSPQEKLDEILLGEMVERLAIMKNQILLPERKFFSYEAVARSMGIEREDIESIKKRFVEMNTEKLLERWPEINNQSRSEKPINERQIGQVKGVYIKVLEKSFGMATSRTISAFSSFNDYLSTVNFNSDPESGSNEVTGNVNLNLYSPDIIYTARGPRYIPILDVFDVARIVGEEGLLGHQGQFLNTEHSSIPKFLKKIFDPATMVSIESLGKIGTIRMTQELGKNPDFVDGIKEKDFEFLRKRFELSEKRKLIERFMNCYQSYLYFENGRDKTFTAEAMYSIFRSPALKSEEHENRIESYYKSATFWSSYYDINNIGMWGYVAADMMAEKILKRLSDFDEDKSREILGHLQIGHWTKKGFEKYFEYLVENVPKNGPEELSESRRN